MEDLADGDEEGEEESVDAAAGVESSPLSRDNSAKSTASSSSHPRLSRQGSPSSASSYLSYLKWRKQTFCLVALYMC